MLLSFNDVSHPEQRALDGLRVSRQPQTGNQYAVSVLRFGFIDCGARQPHQRAQQSVPLTLCSGNGSRKRVIHRNLQALFCCKDTTESPEREGEKFFFLQKGIAS